MFTDLERRIYALVSRREGLKAREIAAALGTDHSVINRELYKSALMREMCYQDREYRWHPLIRHASPHEGIYEFSAWYGTVSEFMELDEETWMEEMTEGCRRIGRNLNDTRGVLHSFRDCRQTMRALFEDLESMTDGSFRNWEIAFEFRLNKARYIRIYTDVLVITAQRVFSLEFKMKNVIEPDEILQAAKYVKPLEIVFGSDMDMLPALVLTGTSELFEMVPIGDRDALLPVCSGDMLFNVFNEYLHFME